MVNEIGPRIKQARTARGLTQAALASAAGIHEISVCLIERGVRQPRIETLSKLAEALECQVADLIAPEPESRAEDRRQAERRDGERRQGERRSADAPAA